jgi:sterol desaturase/sphingolipid hydroxylase (fatty acid hydroxylase superfamily)
MMMGPAVLGVRMHRAAVFGWYFFRGWEAIDGHSGYEFTWSPFRLFPFTVDGDYHYYHHTHNNGNYCSFLRLWDTVFGTNQGFFKLKHE